MFNNCINDVFLQFLEFDYTKAYNLAKSEVVYYYHRLSKRGIYHLLFKEFEEELTQPYSILPLLRPTKSNPNLVSDLVNSAEQQESALHLMSRSILQHKAGNIREGQEFVARDGCARETVDGAGDAVLGALNTSTSRALDSLLKNGIPRAGKKRARSSAGTAVADKESENEQLEVLTKRELIELAKEEKVKITANMNKGQITRAISEARSKSA